MFKKTLLAAAIAGLSANAFAGTVANQGGAADISYQGNVAAGSSLTLSNPDDAAIAAADLDLVLTPGADILENDVIEITVSGAVFDADNSAVTGLDDDDNVANGVVADFLDIKAGTNGTVMRFRANSVIASGTDLSIDAAVLDTSGASVDGDIDMAYKAISLNPAIGDYDVTAAATLGTLANEFVVALGAEAIDQTVDVGAGRTSFAAAVGPDTLQSDNVIITTTNNSAFAQGLGTTEVTYTLTGDFSWLVDHDAAGNDDGTVDPAEVAAGVVVNFTQVGGVDDGYVYSVNEALTTVTIEQTADGAAATLDTVDSFDLTVVADGTPLSESTFTLAVAATDGTDSTGTSSVALGSWDVNGAIFHVPVMYIDSTHANVIRAANRGATSTKAELVLLADGEAISAGTVDIPAYDQVDLVQMVKDAAAANGLTSPIAFDLVFDVVNNNVDITAQYINRNSGSRAVVQTTEL